MAKSFATTLGVIFVLVGIVGFMKHDLFGMHLSNAHNWVHLISGIIAIYFGTAATLRGARNFDYTFGVIYLLLGVFGFIFGRPAMASVLGGAPGTMTDTRLWRVIPGSLELGTPDHSIHIILGILFIIGAVMTRELAVTRLETVDRTRKVA